MKNIRWMLHGVILLIGYGPMQTPAAGQTLRRDDYRINDEDYATDAAIQMLPDIASSQGGFTTVWQETGADFRTTIMARRFDESGRALGGKFRVSEDTAMESMVTSPRVARHFPEGAIGNPTGSFTIVWANQAPVTGDGTVMAQVYELDGDPVGRNFPVDPGIAGTQSEPAIGMDPGGSGDLGNFVVTWADRRNYSDIYARCFDGAGTPAGSAFRVNDDTSRLTRGRPAIARRGILGGFVIVWEESDQYVYGIRRIMGRVFKGDGSPVGSAFRVDSLVPSAFSPSIAMAGDGSFVVAYKTVINAQEDLRVQRFSSDGTHDGAPIAVEGIDGQNQRSPDISLLYGIGPSGYGFVLTWDDVPPNQASGDIYVQLFGGDNRTYGDPILVNRPSGSAEGNLAISTVGYGNVNPPPTRSFIVWQDSREGSQDIWGTLFDMTSSNGPNFRLNNSDVGGAAQIRSAIDATPSGLQVVVWGDDRGSQGRQQVYGKRLSPEGNPLGADFRISDRPAGPLRPEPDLVVFPDSSFTVVWSGAGSASRGDIYLRRFDGAGNPIGAATVVNDTTTGAGSDAPAIAGNAGGSVVVVWRDYRDRGDVAIYGRRLDAGGVPIGDTFRVDSDRNASRDGAPAVAMFADGGFLVVWADDRDGDYNIWAQEFDAAGDRVGINRRVNSSTPEDSMAQISPSVAGAPGGVAMIAWLDYRSGARNGEIQAQLHGRGRMIGGNFRVNDLDATARPLCLECEEEPPTVAAMKQSPGTERDSSFVVAWTDFTNGESDTDILAQLFDRSARVGGNMTLGSAPVGTTQRFPDVARDGLRRNGIYVSWDDDRNISREGWSIWGRIHEWNRGSSGVADAMSMDANNVHIYPNPVAQDAFFSFTLSEPAPVSLRLFTVAGEEVAVIDQGTLRAGEHSIRWNAGRMPIGVYLYRLRIGSEISTGCVVLAAN